MRILVIQIATTLLIIALCPSNASGKALPEEADDARESETTTGTIDTTVRFDIVDDLDNKTDEKPNEKEQSDDQLPILPPIILLDFGNNTDDDNSTTEEKSKRTVNGGLGYGFDQNGIHPRKYSYYFPTGKSGTTVSIEESISPFLPKTIVERVHPNGQRGRINAHQSAFASPSYTEVNAQAQSRANPRPPNLQQSAESQTVFGLRTKPQKASVGSSFATYQNFGTTARPSVGSFAIQNSGYRNNEVRGSTQSPLALGNAAAAGYVTSTAANLANSRPGTFNYPTGVPFAGNENAQLYADQRQQTVRSNVNPHGFVPQTAQPTGSLNYDPRFATGEPQYSNGPRYTTENGVSYENKVFWKYPDGTLSDVPPRTYVETTYPEYSFKQEPAKSQGLVYETSTTENGILSQGPVQFPAVSDETGRKPNPFVSADSLSSSLPQQQVYRLGYQNLVTQRQNVNFAQQRQPVGSGPAPYSPPSSSVPSASSLGRTRTGSSVPNGGYESRYQNTLPRYMVNSPNPEYTSAYTTESTINSTTPISQPLFDSSTEDPFRIKSSSYSSKVESYLDTILSQDNGSKKQSLVGNDLNSYSNLQYSDLLNYNPSISEYVRNPSSILNVRPTFVQAGNSLIPVIILRVDGASPIQTKPTQNINLKALLQEYLIQYAKSIQDLAQPSTYNLGSEPLSKGSTSGSNRSPVLDLIRLTQDDARQSPSYNANSYVGKSSYETSNLGHASDFVSGDYVQRSSGRQKVKSVEILEDPRYTSYKG